MMPALSITLFIASAIVSLAASWCARQFSIKYTILSTPGGHHRHDNGTPLLGGLGPYFALMLACTLVFIASGHAAVVGAFIAIATLFTLIGVVDDIRPLSGLPKLIMQLPLASGFVLVASNVPLAEINMLPFILSVFWLLLVTNGMNFIDGLDGLCAGLTSMMSIGIAAMLIAIYSGTGNVSVVAVIAISLAGASFGFLKMNIYPAKLFLGDTGSNLMGFALAALSLSAFHEIKANSSNMIASTSIILCVFMPIIDCVLTVIRRITLRRPLFDSDWGHIHHRLMDSGFSHLESVRILWSVQAVFCALAFCVATRPSDVAPLWIVISCVVTVGFALALKRKEHAKR